MIESINAMFDLSGQVALITGGGRGIGLSMAHALVAAGCAVALQDIDLAVAQQEADTINKTGGKAMAFGGDIFDMSLPAKLVAEVVEKFGRLDILVNNAAPQQQKRWTDLTVEDFEQGLRSVLISPFLFIQQVLPIFQEQRSGRIINLGSIQQRAANPDMLPYSVSKGALERITLGLCRELAKDNITINQIAPGWINTYRNREQLDSSEKVAQLGRDHVPIGRLGVADDFRGVILLLCSKAGDYITGETIYIDGGLGAGARPWCD
jgi:NAD(P)-dependent dehydrogenase (short-subunit alcohol dehydrogenase family)